jgi:putative nucleotidyltransferase with HDIG domain
MKKEGILILAGNDESGADLARYLAAYHFDLEKVTSFPEALARLASPNAPSAFLVHSLPLDGPTRKTLREIKKQFPLLPVIVLPEDPHDASALSLLLDGAIDQLAGADHPAGVISALRSELKNRELVVQLRLYSQALKRLKAAQAQNLRKAFKLEEIYTATLENLMTALDLRDVETYGHSLVVAKYSQVLAQVLGIKDEEILENIRKGALLHDVGKIAIPDAILKKPGRLTAGEWEKVRLHPSLGYGLIREIKMVEQVGNIILYHHERYDGNGYPKGLKNEEIPLEARIFALADALDAITSHRPYRKERDFKAAKKEIKDSRGRQFDPKTVEAFDSLNLDRWEKIRYETTRIMPAIDPMAELKKKP